MQAIEFKTVLHEGRLTLPPQYLSEWEGKAIRVIVLEDLEDTSQTVEKSESPVFSAVFLETQGFHFNREEANVR